MKKEKIDTPEIYLGRRLARNELNTNQLWTISSVDYMKSVVKNLEERLKKKITKLPAREKTSMSYDYKLELDATSDLDANNITMFKELIGELI